MRRVGASLATLRALAGMSVETAAEAAGISPSYLAKLETDALAPTRGFVADLSAVYAAQMKRASDAGQGVEGQTPEGTNFMTTIADAPAGHEAWPDVRSIRTGKSKLITTDAVAETLAAIVQSRGGPKLIVVEEDRPRGSKVYVHPALCAAVERWYDDLLGSLSAYAPVEVLEP
ncbi:helix-turn-helix domain-containing protein [Microbacterium sp. A1-JK]|uniref:helix-turn-helix domain-containing protein n=1 Tax=Microbacterium sp. A1-JK TaxID=3177516 RepID=UPI003886C901